MFRRVVLARLYSCGFLLLVIQGCGLSTPAGDPLGYKPPTSQENLPLVDHPEYVHWSKFPVGSYVVRKKTVTNQNGSVYVTTVVKLAEKTDQKVVVEQQITVVRPEGTEENEPQQLQFPAQFRLPESVKMEMFSLPSLKAKKVGSDNLTVAGREFEAELFEWQESNEAGPMTVKLWRSDLVPGRMIREESLIIRDGDTSEEAVVELHIPASETPA